MALSNGAWLPIDLLTVILSKLPVKSIIRFKLVKKTWCYFFQNPNFISQHLKISKRNKRLLVYYIVGTMEDPIPVLRMFVDRALVSYIDVDKRLPYLPADIYLLNYCVENGLLCLCSRTTSRITLCNLATREFRLVSQCNENMPNKPFTFWDTIGFGFEPLSNDYKVLYIRKYMDKEKMKKGPDQCAVYKMSTDSWRILQPEFFQLFEDLIIYNNENNACVNGVYYWQTDYFDILAFYLSTEVFQIIKSPCPIRVGRLMPLKDCIAFWDTEMINRNDQFYDVWLLNDEGQWTKLLKFAHVLEFGRLFGFWNNGKVIVESITAQLLLYDLEIDDFNELEVHAERYGDLFQVHTYEESLVSIKRN